MQPFEDDSTLLNDADSPTHETHPMNSIPINSNASLLEVGATLPKSIDVTGCYRSSEIPPKLADKNPEEKSVKIHNIKNTLNLPRDPEYDSDEDIQSLEDDPMDNLDNSPHVAIDAMNSISIDSNASLLETAKVGATLLKSIDVTGCYGSSEIPKLADNNPEVKNIKIHKIKNTLNLPKKVRRSSSSSDEFSFSVQESPEFPWTQLLDWDQDSDSDSELSFHEQEREIIPASTWPWGQADIATRRRAINLRYDTQIVKTRLNALM